MSIQNPSYLNVTPYLQGLFQHETARFLAHTYTRHRQTPITSGPNADDDWGQPNYTTPPPEPNQPCFYQVERGAIVRPYGIISQNLPMLTIPFNDPLQEGDHVSDIFTLADPARGIPAVQLLVGPVEVESINDQQPGYGGVMLRQAILRDITAVGAA